MSVKSQSCSLMLVSILDRLDAFVAYLIVSLFSRGWIVVSTRSFHRSSATDIDLGICPQSDTAKT
jgi:hypothetical protein